MKTHDLTIDGVSLVAYEWGQPGGQQVVLAHATGFHGRCWDKVVDSLPNDWHVFALDARGHGLSEKTEPVTWGRFAHDLVGVLDELQVRDAIGVGHSMGGHCMAHACALRPEFFVRLVLVDPVIFPAESYTKPPGTFMSLDEHPVARRKGEFASWQAFRDRLKDRHPYTLWLPDVLDDYCRYGVVPDPDGEGVKLACPGRVEASVYMGNFDTDIYPLLGKIEQPVQILRAPGGTQAAPEMDFAASPTWPDLAAAFLNAEDCYQADLTHFMPMQDPQRIAKYIRGEEI
ncbi:MAG: alpha/beta fold hydrolase [Pseudomonadales bacterium]|nr:alpha/beta fold hydrolase [Pseudomonadales bacterium]